jgi:hypothetical protein
MAIHWWRTDRLVTQLVNAPLSSRDMVNYFVAATTFDTVAIYWGLWVGANRNWALLFEGVVVLIIAIVGIRECFVANGGADGENFLARFFAISVPVSVKLGLAGFIVTQSAYFGLRGAESSTTIDVFEFGYHIFSFLVVTAFPFVFYWRIAHHLRTLKARIGNSGLEVSK